MSISPIMQLDLTLRILDAKYKTDEIENMHLSVADIVVSMSELTSGFVTIGEVISVVDKLYEDKYISSIVPVPTNPLTGEIYTLSLTGKMFIDDGGYTGAIKRRNAENTRLEIVEQNQKDYQSNILWLTLILAVGTTIAAWYYFLEICKHYHWFHC